MHRIGAGNRHRDQSVAHLVIGNDLALLRVKQAIAFFEAGHHALDRIGEVFERHRVGAATGGEQGRLVDEIGEIGAGETRRQRGDLLGIDAGREPGLLRR